LFVFTGSAGIVFTQGPIFRFFAPQGQHVAPIKHQSKICQGGLFLRNLQVFAARWRHYSVSNAHLLR